jgi:hypothetical protein
MAWTDKVRSWDYDLVPVYGWFADIVEFHVQRTGWPAYIGIAAVIIVAGLVFKPTRPIFTFLLTNVINSLFSYAQIVGSLLTVHVLGGLWKLMLSFFHRARNWVKESITRRG